MGGGNSHQRTINRSAKARIIDEVVGTVLKQMDRLRRRLRKNPHWTFFVGCSPLGEWSTAGMASC
jgi:hypothetical protein